MLRLLWVLLLTTLLGSGGVAAGFAADVPAIVQFVFVGCLGLFVVTLTTGALMVADPEGSRAGREPRGHSGAAPASGTAEAHGAHCEAPGAR
ncbi:MAG: hypothetical protein ACREYD_05570 [Casimicrobiaceae bacterium]